jgi:tRNA threonylcarbamoyladenosine biosynthesis protein TsaB
MLLTLDSATDAVTVALFDGTTVVAEHTEEDRLRHGERLAPAIARVLAAAGVQPDALTRIAVGVGPGPFTGLRIGIVTATTMAEALGIEVVGVCTLDVIASAVEVDGPFLVATDARRKEVYWAAYTSPRQRRTEPAVSFPAELATDLPADLATDLPVAGNGPLLYPSELPNRVDPRLPSAGDLARLVGSGSARLLPTRPLYLRRPDATVPAGRKKVT